MSRAEIDKQLAGLPDNATAQLAECVQHIFNVDIATAFDVVKHSQDSKELEIVVTWINGYCTGAFEYLNAPVAECFTQKGN